MKYISYLGSKMKLVDFLDENIFSNFNKKDKDILFIDAFSGTTFVSNYIFNNTNWDIILCDFSPFVHVLSSIINPNIDKERIKKITKQLDEKKGINGIIFNELSINGNVQTIENKEKTFENQDCKSRMFFSETTGKKIDEIKNEIFKLYNEKKINENEKNILLLMLLNFTDRNANTTSVYGAYLKKDKTKNKPFINKELLQEILEKEYKKDRKILSKTGDIIDNLKSIKNTNKEKTIIYLDPPYNTRRYETNYHILNYIVKKDFNINDIKKNSKTAMPSKTVNNAFASKRETLLIFEKMIKESLRISNHIYISYNNEGVVTQNFMENLSKKLNFKLNTVEKNYKKFTSGEKTLDLENKKKQVKEIIWQINPIFS